MKPRIGKILISSLLVTAMTLQPVTYAMAAETSSQETTSATENKAETEIVELPVIRETKYENGAGTPKANGYDSQQLGVWVKAGTTFRIRQTNKNFGKNLTVKLRTDDNWTEQSTTIPSNGDWATVTASADSVPFVISVVGSENNKPVVEFETADTYTLPVYKRGDGNEAEFFKKWNELQAPYAVYECKSVVLLVPERDKYANRFGTLEDLFDYYDGMLGQYNAFAGLTEDTTAYPWDILSGSRYFIKPNRHGAGAGYYGGSEVAQNGASIEAYLQYGWLINHEIGHGYMSFGGVNTSEVWNNIFGYYYQVTCRGTSNWLGMDEDKRAEYEQVRKERGYYNPDDRDLPTKLYFWVNMLDKIGPQKSFAHMYRTFRYNKYNGIGNDTSGPDMYAQYLTQGSGYNVAPYFELWGMTISDGVKKMLAEEGVYENVYTLRNLTSSDAKAQEIQNALGLQSMYSLVSTRELNSYASTPKETVKLTLDEAAFNALKDKEIEFTDGVRAVKKVTVSDRNLEATLPIGVYNLHVPGDGVTHLNYDAFVVVEMGKTTTSEVTGLSVEADPYDFADFKFTFKGASNVVYFTAETDMKNNVINVERINVIPHQWIPGYYSHFKVLKADGTEKYSSVHYGNRAEEETRSIPIEVGDIIEVLHKERNGGDTRLRIDSTGINYSLRDNDDTETIRFVVGENGLARTSAPAMSEDQQKNPYYHVVCYYMNLLKSKYPQSFFKDEGKLIAEKAKVMAAYDTMFTEELKERFKDEYKGYFPFSSDQSLTVDAVADQAYTGNEITPALVVKNGAQTLTKDSDYTVTWKNNVDAGTARATIIGKGDYANSVASAVFTITPASEANLTVNVAEKTVAYTGGEKRPELTVTYGGQTLVKGVDYRAVYSNNVAVGRASIAVKGIGNYEGASATETFEIVANDAKIDVIPANSSYIYTGETIKPSVQVVCGGRLLEAGTEYIVIYGENREAGKDAGVIMVTPKAAGLPTEQVMGTFDIVKRDTVPTQGSSFSNWKMEFGGYADRIYTRILFDMENSQIKVNRLAGRIHKDIPALYLSVNIYDKDGNCLKVENRKGNENVSADSESTYAVSVGDRVEVYHGEYSNTRRAKIYSAENNSVTLPMGDYKTVYEVTKWGLRKVSPNEVSVDELKQSYYSLITQYMDTVKEANEQHLENFELSGRLTDEKAKIDAGLAALDESYRTQFAETYSGLYPFSAGHHIGNWKEGEHENYGTCTVCGAVIEKNEQKNVPTVTGGVGEITGTTADMEYAAADSDSWTDCAADSTLVGEGTWKVRFKETADTYAGQSVNVTVEKAVWALSLAGDGAFKAEHIGYESADAKSFTVTNIGNKTISAILVNVNDKDSFVLNNAGAKASLAKDEAFTFTVQPKAGLAPGTYTAEVSVTASNEIQKTVSLSFTVEGHRYENQICAVCGTPKGEQGAVSGVAGEVRALTGTTSAMEYSSAAEGQAWTACTDGTTAVAEGTWFVRYKETEELKEGPAASFKVYDKASAVTVNGNGSFTAAHEGYTAAPAGAQFTVTNKGYNRVTDLLITVSGEGAEGFAVNANAANGIDRDGQMTFSVQPKAGLAPGVYAAAVNVKADGGINETVSLRFEVTAHEFKDHTCIHCGADDGLPRWEKGDINCDGKVNLTDMRIMLRAVCQKQELTEEQEQLADMDGNGKVDLMDLREILRIVCGK